MAIHIVTDSTADLTPDLIREAGVDGPIHVVPLTVHFGDEEYRDGVDLTTGAFYEKLTTSPVMPRTSQPSPQAFIDLYRAISQPGDAILSFHISSRLSGTIQSATLAARQLEDREVEVVDTRVASLGTGLIALMAARARDRGDDKEAILRQTREAISGLSLLFVVDTLEYLQKNGRIGKAQALVGSLLNVKPILTIEEGLVAPVEKARGRAKARNRLLELVQERNAGRRVEAGAVVHSCAPEEDVEAVKGRLEEAFPGTPFSVALIGPTVGCHAGPGTLGVITLAR